MTTVPSRCTTRSPVNCRACVPKACAFSGASSPYSRTLTAFPSRSTLMVSPSLMPTTLPVHCSAEAPSGASRHHNTITVAYRSTPCRRTSGTCLIVLRLLGKQGCEVLPCSGQFTCNTSARLARLLLHDREHQKIHDSPPKGQ